MFGNIESYFPSDNIHLFVPFERLQLRIFQSIYFNSNNKNWLFLHLLLPTNLSRLVWISAKVGLQLVGVCLVQPGHRVHQAPSFPLPLPCSPIPTCLQHAPRPRERKVGKLKKTNTHPPPWSFRVIFRLWLWQAPRLKRGLQTDAAAHRASGCWQEYQ